MSAAPKQAKQAKPAPKQAKPATNKILCFSPDCKSDLPTSATGTVWAQTLGSLAVSDFRHDFWSKQANIRSPTGVPWEWEKSQAAMLRWASLFIESFMRQLFGSVSRVLPDLMLVIATERQVQVDTVSEAHRFDEN